jgi:rhodanese-related sulfurtransferase
MMTEITLEELQSWQLSGTEYQLIDVRESEEHEQFNIGGLLIPLSELYRHTHRLMPDLPIVVYCKRGMRSQIAIQRWQQQLPEARFFNLRGGIGLPPADKNQ